MKYFRKTMGDMKSFFNNPKVVKLSEYSFMFGTSVPLEFCSEGKFSDNRFWEYSYSSVFPGRWISLE